MKVHYKDPESILMQIEWLIESSAIGRIKYIEVSPEEFDELMKEEKIQNLYRINSQEEKVKVLSGPNINKIKHKRCFCYYYLGEEFLIVEGNIDD